MKVMSDMKKSNSFFIVLLFCYGLINFSKLTNNIILHTSIDKIYKKIDKMYFLTKLILCIFVKT